MLGPDPHRWLAVRIAGKEYYPVWNYLGSLVAVLDERGSVVKRYRYDSYGSVLHEEGDLPVAPHFAGQPIDPDTGLVRFGARYYSPKLRRFISPDPRGPDKDGSLYGYARSNPLRYVDSDGLESEVVLPPRAPSYWDVPGPPRIGPVRQPSLDGVTPRPGSQAVHTDAVVMELERIANEAPANEWGRARANVARETLDMLEEGQAHLALSDIDPANPHIGGINRHSEEMIADVFLGTNPYRPDPSIPGSGNRAMELRHAAAMTVHEVGHVGQRWLRNQNQLTGKHYHVHHEMESYFKQWLVDPTLGGSSNRDMTFRELVEHVMTTKGRGELDPDFVAGLVNHHFPSQSHEVIRNGVQAVVQEMAPHGRRAMMVVRLAQAAQAGAPTVPPGTSKARRLAQRLADKARKAGLKAGRAGGHLMRALRYGGRAARVIGRIGMRVAAHATPIGWVQDAEDAYRLGAWLGTSAAEVYIEARRRRAKFFKTLDIFGDDDDEDEEEKKQREERFGELGNEFGVANIVLLDTLLPEEFGPEVADSTPAAPTAEQPTTPTTPTGKQPTTPTTPTGKQPTTPATPTGKQPTTPATPSSPSTPRPWRSGPARPRRTGANTMGLAFGEPPSKFRDSSGRRHKGGDDAPPLKPAEDAPKPLTVPTPTEDEEPGIVDSTLSAIGNWVLDTLGLNPDDDAGASGGGAGARAAPDAETYVPAWTEATEGVERVGDKIDE